MAHADKDKAVAMRGTDPADLVERWFSGSPRSRLFPEFFRGFGEEMDLLKVEEFTEGDQVVVRVEMPGIDPDKDVQISVSDHTLHLQAERREESKTEDKGRYRSDFRYGSFSRTVPLPVGTTEEDVKATYKDGILEVRIPIDRAAANAKRVPIQRI